MTSRRGPEPDDTGTTGTMREVARRAGVSVATVSRVANANYPVSAATRARVQKAMDDLGYVVNDNARTLAGTGSRMIVLVLNELVDPFFGYIARGVQLEAATSGRVCLVLTTGGDPRHELEAFELALGRRAEMVILVGGSRVDDAYVAAVRRQRQRLAANGTVLVLCGRPTVRGVDTPSVQYENEAGAFTLTDHLLRRGHRRILYLGGPAGLSTTDARVAGYRRALESYDVAVDESLVRIGAFGREWSRRTMAEVLESGLEFSAVFAGNDICAAGAYAAIKAAGLRIPDDLSVVGYDDVPVAVDLDPPLTTINVPLEQLGREAVRVGLAQTSAAGADPYAVDRTQSRLGVYLVERDSVATLRD